MEFPKYPHNAIICGKTNSGKTHLMLDLIEEHYYKHFKNVVIICPTYDHNKTYRRSWLKNCIIIRGNLLETLRKLMNKPPKNSTLIIIDDCSAEKDLEKHRSAISEIAFSGRHMNLTTWFLSQRYMSIPKDFRENVAFLILTKSWSKPSKKMILEENDFLTKESLDYALKNDKKIFLNNDKGTYKFF